MVGNPQMKAAVWSRDGGLRLEERPIPQVVSGHSLVKVALAGICATDREILEGRMAGISPSIVPGHEITGTIVDGPGGKHASPGDRIIVDTFLPCEVCDRCTSRDPSDCRDPGEIGFTKDGGWAQYLLVPNDRLYRVPDSVSDEEAVIAEPFAMTLGAFLDCHRDLRGKNILVVGSGMAAAGFVSCAFALGATSVQVCLKSLTRADIFSMIDPRVTIVTADEVEPESSDIGVDSIGSQDSIKTAIRGTRRKGLVICYGLAQQTIDDFPLGEVVLRNLTLSGHTNPRNVWPQLIELLRTRTVSTRGLVDTYISLDELPETVLVKSGAFRTVIRPFADI